MLRDEYLTNCGNCKFFVRHEYVDYQADADYGQCRRFPPKRISETTSGFPIVTDDLWCAEWRPDYD